MALKGKVKWFSNVKGYGFLESQESPKDVFVHYKSIDGEGYKTLKDKEEVEFELVEGDKGPHAAKVVRVKKNQPKKEEAGKS
ncbi:MAG: cold shock domain-containing protein [Candidatus Omnitrophica bacterium]|nr:cold shock domain-containing protein [Candidatus Omnitrophota bacterium]